MRVPNIAIANTSLLILQEMGLRTAQQKPGDSRTDPLQSSN